MRSSLGKRPCRICRRWFAPDPRVGERQHVCQREECQTERHRRDQAEWYRRNPGYFIARRLGERAAESDPRPPRMPPPLGRLPWELAQDEFGVQGAGFLGSLGRLIVQWAQDEIPPPGPVFLEGSRRQILGVSQDERRRVPG